MKKIIAIVILSMFLLTSISAVGIKIEADETTSIIKESLQGATIYVDDDFDESTPGWQVDHFDKIQDGVDAAEKNDIVYVYSGTYYENVFIDKSIDLTGENKKTTIIDGSGNGNVIWIWWIGGHEEINEVEISGFTIVNSGKNENGIRTDSHLGIIKDNIISNNDLGIFLCESSSNEIKNNIISNNGCGINLYSGDLGSDSNIISENIIKSNSGYGIYIGWFPHGMSRLNQIYHNDFIGNAGGNAYDDCSENDEWYNIWDDGTGKGNYWDDYEEKYPEANKILSKGIWDTPYYIYNLSDMVDTEAPDRYPLIKPYNKFRSRSVNLFNFDFLEIFLDQFPMLEKLLSLIF